MGAFTPEEKVRVRLHLGYPLQGTLRSMVAGLPTIVESNWQLESLLADGALTEETIGVCRSVLKQLDDILFVDKVDARLEHKVEAIEELRINLKHSRMLGEEYIEWQQILAQCLCVPVNPDFSGVGSGSAGVSNFSVS